MNLISGLTSVAPPSGLGPEAGMVLKLDDQPWRFGVSARAPISGGVGGELSTDMFGVKRAVGYIVPQNVVFPAQLAAGFALQLGPRPLNPRWIDPSEDIEPLQHTIEGQREARHARDTEELAKLPEEPCAKKRRRELEATERAIRRIEDQRVATEEKSIQAAHDARYTSWPRPKLLVVVDAVVTAPVDNAVAVSSFLAQKLETNGRSSDDLAARRPRGRARSRSLSAAVRQLPRAVALRRWSRPSTLHLRR